MATQGPPVAHHLLELGFLQQVVQMDLAEMLQVALQEVQEVSVQ
jgi:hypothetical protein